MEEVERREFESNPTVQVRQYSKFWNLIINKSVGDNVRDINLIAAAYEGGHRLERRDINIFTAFTYGKKLRYEDLDDARFAYNLKNKAKIKKISQQRRTGK
jgi:hypothetical protein